MKINYYSYYRMHYNKYIECFNDYVIEDKQFNTEEELKDFIKNCLNEKDKIKSVILVKKEITNLDIEKIVK